MSIQPGAKKRATNAGLAMAATAWLWLGLTSVGRAAEGGSGATGFTREGATKLEAWEKKFDTLLNPADQQAWLERLSSAPNHVGSPHNRENAEFMVAKYREWGWEAKLEQFSVLYPTPKKLGLEMVSPKQFTARLQEPPVPGDRTSTNLAGALPPWAAFGGDGDVTAELVYVNQGMPDDYKELARRGVEVRGRIVIARYGGGWRGLKPKLAQERGALGCIIYSDPRDDGYGEGDVYPKGGFRPKEGVQRGSVLDMPIQPGDPLTPGVGATEKAARLPIEKATTILKIPVLPISYGDARPLLEALGGPVAPAGWRGGLPLTYHIGPGPAKVHLTVEAEWTRKTIYNVIAMMPGGEAPDQWVIRGNHHDGWVCGAWDPLSANVAMMAEAKAIGALVKEGWKPKRTLVYASWDGEEPGLLGSTEWVETHEEELRKKGVLYVNSDTNGRGFLRAGGSHSFQNLVSQAASVVMDPQTGVSVVERMRAKLRVDGESARGDLPLYAMGSGSDFTPFLQHLGVASLDVRFGGEDDDSGIYHSAYDSFDHYLRFGDPGFVYGVALAKVNGRVVWRAANADLIPARFTDFSSTVAKYGDEVRRLADDLRARAERTNRLIADHKLADDPLEGLNPPEREEPVPFLNFAPLENVLARLAKSANACDEACRQAVAGSADKGRLERANALLLSAERLLCRERGLPGRPWYRHMIYAPGLNTGYGAKTLPAVREGIEEGRWAEVTEFMGVVAEAIGDYASRLDEITASLKP